MTISFSSLNTKNIIRHDQESVEGVSIIHPKSSKYPPGCLQDSRGLATCEPLQIMGMGEPLLCGTADGPGRFEDADAVEDDGQGGCVMDYSGPEGADLP